MRLYAFLLSCLCLNTLLCEQKPMVVVIPSYNNAEWYQRNLDSVCFQNYDRYRIIYIDDCSPDGTADLVQAYIDKHNLHDKITFMRNQTNCGAMANHYKAVWMCQDNEIVVHLDGDDWLKHNDVLARVNQEYQNPDVWLTYGQFERFPDGKKGYCRPVPIAVQQRNAFRECDWFTSHLRTFYAGLFKQIALKDFVHNGNYFRITCDMAMFFPLLELAGSHMRCIDDILYVYNEQTNLNDYKRDLLSQLHCDKVIRSRAKYCPAHTYMRRSQDDQVDIVFFFDNQPCIEHMLTQLVASDALITVLHRHDQCTEIDRFKAQFPEVNFVSFRDDLSASIRSIVNKPGYIVCIKDAYTLHEPLPLKEAIAALEQTQALSFHFALGEGMHSSQLLKRKQAVPSLVQLPQGYCAWRYTDAEFDWRQPYGQMSLYRKTDLKRLIDGTVFNSYQELMQIVQLSRIDLHEMGLCGKRAFVSLQQKELAPSWATQLMMAGCDYIAHEPYADALKRIGFTLLHS